MPEILNMALRNITRRALLRNLLTITGLAIFVLLFILVTSITLTMQTIISSSLSDLGGEIIIWDKGTLLPYLSKLPENYTNPIKQIEYVKYVSPQITYISSVDTQDLRPIIGMNPSDIPLLYTYEMVEGTMISNNESKAVVGYLFAGFIEKHVGDNITINRQTLPVIGIFKTNTWMDHVVIVPFETAQTIFGLKGRVSTIVVTVTNPSKIDFVIHEIKREIPDVDVFRSQEATARLSPIMNSITWVTYMLSAFAGVACFFGITNIIMTDILERTREIGILKALGAKNRDVAKMMIYESSVLGTVGGLLGCLISSILIIQGIFIPITSTTQMRILIFPDIFFYGMFLSVIISILAALYPVWRATRVHPTEVLKIG